LKTCADFEIKHDCPKCEVTELTKEELVTHLTDECKNMEVTCVHCRSEPCKRYDFSQEEHDEIKCLKMLSQKVKQRA